MTVVTITDDCTRADVEEALTYAAATAARMTHAVGSGEYVTPWDRAHEVVDGLLDELERKA